jgi:hypothetical protein
MAHKRPASARGLLITCNIAGQAKWLKLDPAARDILTIKEREGRDQ